MKLKFFLIAISFLFIQNFSFTQSEALSAFYCESGFIGVPKKGVGVNGAMSFVLKDKWFLSLDGTSLSLKVEHIPSNYSNPAELLGLFTLGILGLSSEPRDNLLSLGVLAGRRYANGKGNAQFIPKMGITRNTFSKTVFEYRKDNLFFPKGTYAVESEPEIKKSMGFAYGADFILTKENFGLKFSINGNANQDRSYLGFGASLLVGLMR